VIFFTSAMKHLYILDTFAGSLKKSCFH